RRTTEPVILQYVGQRVLLDPSNGQFANPRTHLRDRCNHRTDSVDRFDFDVAWVRYDWKYRRLPHGCLESDNWRGICSRLRSWRGGRNTRHARKIEIPTFLVPCTCTVCQARADKDSMTTQLTKNAIKVELLPVLEAR